MIKTDKPLHLLTADDLMSREVIMIPQEMSLRAAAHLLSLHHISGAPVVDANGRCIGVISTTDVLHWTEKEAPGQPTPASACHRAWQFMESEELLVDQVANCMTKDPVTVIGDVPIATLSRRMLDAHIHRVIVVDKENRPIGIVSSTDILAAVASLLPTPEPNSGEPHVLKAHFERERWASATK